MIRNPPEEKIPLPDRHTVFRFLAAFILLVTLAAGTLWAMDGRQPSGVYGSWLSVIPPLVAIGFALVTREVLFSLFAGIWIGALFLSGHQPLAGTALSIDLIIDSLVNRDHIAIVVFSLMLGGMVGVISRSGGAAGVVELLGRYARNRTRGQVLIGLSAFLVFFDDYANMLIRGSSLRPMSDRLRISREKLAYIIDSTAAPLAVSAVITTWIGFEITQIQNAFERLAAEAADPALAASYQAAADGAFILFLHSIPYLFYPLLALAFVFMVIVMRRDFGPMLKAERRAASGDGVLRPGSRPAADLSLAALQPDEGGPRRWSYAVLPVMLVIFVALAGLYLTGIRELAPGQRTVTAVIGGSDPFAALLWASFTGVFVAIALPVAARTLSTSGALEAFLGGMQSMLMAILILVLAWAIGAVTREIGTGPFLANLLQETLPLVLLPGLVFLIASAIAFSTGTSWGTMAILFPIVIPLAVAMGAWNDPAAGGYNVILLGTISSVMGGAVFGDHCSPISDTTVLSSMSTACDLIDHVRTQLPYALLIAVVAFFVGELPAAFDRFHPLWAVAIGICILWLVLRIVGRNPEKR